MPKIAIIRKITLIGALVNVFLSILKISIGTISNSSALIADGIHSFSDLVTDFAIIIGARFWSAPADAEHPYGHGRFETITNIIIGSLLFIVALSMGWHALNAITNNKTQYTPTIATFIAALFSIVLKEILFKWTAIYAKRVNSQALYANAWHHRSDALSSYPVAIAVILNWIWPNIKHLDQLATIFVSVLIIKASFDIIWPSIIEITEKTKDQKLIDDVRLLAQSSQNIKEIHKVRTRHQGSDIFIDFHILVSPQLSILDAHSIAEDLKTQILATNNNIFEVLIHIEPDIPSERYRNA